MVTEENKAMPGSIKNLLLTDKTPDDVPVLRLINELAGLVPGVRPKDALKNYLLSTLPSHNKKLRDYGSQLAGVQG
jgi:hypothetical protein